MLNAPLPKVSSMALAKSVFHSIDIHEFIYSQCKKKTLYRIGLICSYHISFNRYEHPILHYNFLAIVYVFFFRHLHDIYIYISPMHRSESFFYFSQMPLFGTKLLQSNNRISQFTHANHTYKNQNNQRTRCSSFISIRKLKMFFICSIFVLR